MSPLAIYSKPRGAGDQSSGGRGKLLRATSNLTRVDVLVRETLQNAWDARLSGAVPTYGVDLRKPNSDGRIALRTEVFRDTPKSLSVLRLSLSDPDMRVMEIYDRGTSGLNGPYHANRAAAPGSPNNFNSFVFDIGTTKRDESSGGTFGFGKTATFEVSHAHTVIYWSVCQDPKGDLEHRLIASSLHEPYDDAGVRYTGAHWWGVYDGTDITPIRGEQAQVLGERLFRRHFESGETGTSILVIDPEVRLGTRADSAAIRVPVRTPEHESLFVDTVVGSLASNAWPKAIGAGAEYPPMIFHVSKDGEEIEVTQKISESYKTFGASLTSIRDHLDQLQGPVPPHSLPVLKERLYPIILRPRFDDSESPRDYFGERTDNMAGVLHLMIGVAPPNSGKADDGSSTLNPPTNKLCFMRSTAELVVYYDDVVNLDIDGLSWTGVFKPTPECDRHFASAEPPTHDAWSPNTAETEVSSYVVRQALSAIKRKTREFLDAQQAEHKSTTRSVRQVSTALGGFVPVGAVPIAVEPSSTTSRGSTRSPRNTGPSVNLLSYEIDQDGLGYSVNFRVVGAENTPIRISPKASAQTAEGLMQLDQTEYSIEWSGQLENSDEAQAAVFAGGSDGNLRIRTGSFIALDLSFDVESEA